MTSSTLEWISERMRLYAASEIDARISPNDAMNNQWYFGVGRSAIDNIAMACIARGLTEVRSVLDLPCGHGRVLRHLVRMFPDAQFDACDLDADGIDFCSKMFGANPVHSTEELSNLTLPNEYDLIWIGSLFTHTSLETTKRWLKHLSRFLSRDGLMVATFHGRWCKQVHKVAPYIEDDLWAQILDQFEVTGYGYADYRIQGHSYIQGSYGISLAEPWAIVRLCEEVPGVRLYMYRERAWSDHQDVVAIGRPAYDKPWPPAG